MKTRFGILTLFFSLILILAIYPAYAHNDTTPPEAYFANVPIYPDQYENISGTPMIFTGGISNITGYVNDTDLAYWNVTLLKDGSFNSAICSGDGAVDGVLCTWNTSETCSGECENYTLVLNATDLAGYYNDTSQIISITIDNTPPILSDILDLVTGEGSITGRINVTDTYLKDVEAYVLNESNFDVIHWNHLCNETQGENCDKAESGTFNTTWYKETYSLDNTTVPVYYTYCVDCDVVPGCFKRNSSVDYECGCVGEDCQQEERFYLIYNSSVHSPEKALLGLGRDSWCTEDACVINTTLIQDGISTFKPRLEYFNDSSEGYPWIYSNASEITLYSIGSADNKNLTSSEANGTYKFMFQANDYVTAQNSIYESFNVTPSVPFDWIKADKSVLNEGHIYVGDTVRYLINITNIGEAGITNITVVDIFDSDLNYTSASIEPDTINYSGRSVNWNNVAQSNLSAGDSILLYVNFSAIYSAPYVSNIANITAVDEFENITSFEVESSTGISQGELDITGLPSWIRYDVIDGRNMTFTSGFTGIIGYVAMTNLASWTISLRNSSGVVNRTLCFNTIPVDGDMCSWNTTKYCSGECEGYELTLNATDTHGNSKTVSVKNITIDNIPPNLTHFNVSYVHDGFNVRANITDHYLRQVNAYLFTGDNYTAVGWVHLCGEAQGNNCDRSESGMFNTTWFKEVYSINSTPVPVYYEYCVGCNVVSGCFKQNNSVDYYCGEENERVYLIYNNSVEGNEKPLLGLGRDSSCTEGDCVINTTIIQDGESKFKPRIEYFNSSSGGYPWIYSNTSEITLYSIGSADNKNLTVADANSTFKFMLESSDYVSTLDVMGQLFNSDATPPSIELVSPTTLPGNYSQNWIEADVTAEDLESGLNRITIYLYNTTRLVNSESSTISPLSMNFTDLRDGTYYLNATATDNAENSNHVDTQTIVLDTHTPVTSYSLNGTIGDNGWYTSDVIVSFGVNDGNFSSGYYTEYKTGGEEWTRGTSVLLTSTATVQYYSIDYAGNVEDAKSVTVNIDKVKPIVEDLVLSDTLPTVNSTIEINATATDENLDTVQVQIDSETYNMTTDTPDIYFYDFTPTEQKTYNVTIIAEDIAGNINNSVTAQFSAAIQEQETLELIENETANTTFSDVDVYVELGANATSEVNLTISKFAEQPANVSTLSNGVSFYNINTSDLTNVSWVLIKVYYTDDEIAGLDESTLKMTWYNESSGEWVTLAAGSPEWVYDTGVNTGENYVWANLTHFSMYGITGSPIIPPTTTTIKKGGEGGGGGGGAGGTTTTTLPAVVQEANIPNISAGGTGKVSFANIPITDIAIEVKNAVQNVKITITKADAQPATVAIAVPGQTYAYLSIDKTNINDSDITNVKIKFKVEKSWISSNNIDITKIALYRYSDGQWTKLPTVKLSEDSTYVYFESTSPGLSAFAISGELMPTAQMTTTTTIPSQKALSKITIAYSLMIIAIAIVVIVLLVIAFRKK